MRRSWIKNGISLVLENIEATFNSLTIKPIIANDEASRFATGKAMDVINDLIRSHFPNDKISTVPHCDCGRITNAVNESDDDCEPIICPDCGTPVRRIIDRPLQSEVWMRAPHPVPAFISPRFWTLFNTYFSVDNFNLLEWLVNPTYQPPGRDSAKVAAKITVLRALEIPRGYDSFYDNFDKIMDAVIKPKPFLNHKSCNIKSKLRICADWRLFLRVYRDCIFTKYLPYPSKVIMVSEQSGGITYVDPTMVIAANAVKNLCGIYNAPLELSVAQIHSRVAKTNKLMAEYHAVCKADIFGRKTGMCRKQLGSTRSHHSGRAVVAPLWEPHEYDELHTPWAWTITLCRSHLINKMLRREQTPKQIFRRFDEYTCRYDPFLHELFNELLAESPEGGLPLALLRNPTLERLSDQNFRITKIITDPTIYAILMSVLAIKGANTDFDGDQLQAKLQIDDKEKQLYARLGAHLGICDSDKPRAIKDVMTLHPEIYTLSNNFIAHYSERV